MCNNIYKTMVKAGIAEEVEEAIQYNAGLPTKFKLTHPELFLFVNETGCNTNKHAAYYQKDTLALGTLPRGRLGCP
jgi:hypothetical protein